MKKLLLALLFFCTTFLNAQIVFEKGYFIDEKDNRTECFIENIDWRDNPTSFIYKMTLEESIGKTATIANVKEFGIDGVSRYKRFAIKIERSSTEMSKLSKSRNPEFKLETLFLKYLVQGDANLYSYTDHNMIKYFYDTKAVTTEQLISIKYFTNDYATNTYNQFRQQLSNNVHCGEMTENTFKNIRYSKTDLIAHFLKFNQCSNGTSIDYNEKNLGKGFTLKLIAGVEMANIAVSDETPAYNLSTKIKGTYFKIGAELEYFLPFNKNTWSIVLQPTYTKCNLEKKYIKKDGLTSSGTMHYTATLDLSSLSIPMAVRHYFFTGKESTIFVNAGYALEFAGSSSLDFENEEDFINARDNYDLNPHGYVLLGSGFNYKKYSVEVRVNAGQQLVDNYFLSAKNNAVGLILGYRLF